MDNLHGAAAPGSRVTLRLPAHRDFVSGIRALTRSMGVLCDLTVDDIEDLQMAVDEAVTVLLPLVNHEVDELITVDFVVDRPTLHISIAITRQPEAMPDRTGLAWAMLTALDADLDVRADGPTLALHLSRTRQGAPL
jgi:serine/threonine-protein kinase RsbW